jgi:hypothetical protein
VGEEVAGLFYLMQANKVSVNAFVSAPCIPSFSNICLLIQ